jgi:hypothetical protein
MLSGDRHLCPTASDTVDAVRSASPKGFKFKNIKNDSIHKKVKPVILKFETLNSGEI